MVGLDNTKLCVLRFSKADQDREGLFDVRMNRKGKNESQYCGRMLEESDLMDCEHNA